MLSFNCHHIGTIQSFDASTQTATATINYVKTVFPLNKSAASPVAETQNWPIVTECPVIFLGGGSTAVTLPVSVGDECLILFNDRDLDHWFSGGTGSPNATARLHSFSDAIALVGLRSLTHILSHFDTTRALIRGGTVANSITAVGVNPSNSKVLITNTYPGNATTLNTLLQALITDLRNLVSATASITVTAPSGGGPTSTPLNASTINDVGTQLSTVANRIGALLE